MRTETEYVTMEIAGKLSTGVAYKLACLVRSSETRVNILVFLTLLVCAMQNRNRNVPCS